MNNLTIFIIAMILTLSNGGSSEENKVMESTDSDRNEIMMNSSEKIAVDNTVPVANNSVSTVKLNSVENEKNSNDRLKNESDYSADRSEIDFLLKGSSSLKYNGNNILNIYADVKKSFMKIYLMRSSKFRNEISELTVLMMPYALNKSFFGFYVLADNFFMFSNIEASFGGAWRIKHEGWVLTSDLEYAVNDMFKVDLGYKYYTRLGRKYSSGITDENKIDSYTINLGIKIRL